VPAHSYRVTVVFDYSVQYDDPPENEDRDYFVDDDYLHDALMDNFDTVDLEFTTEHPVYDGDGDEVDDETLTLQVNCDNVREIEVQKVED